MHAPEDKEQALVLSLLARIVAIAALSLAVVLTYDYPMYPGVLGFGLLVYAALLIRKPLSWLVIIPALVPLLDLTPWTGRLAVTELDLIILVTISITWWRLSRFAGSLHFARSGMMLLLALAVSTLVSGVVGWQSLSANVGTTDLVYFLPSNALRVAKGTILALLLVPALALAVREEPKRAVSSLILGMQLGILGLGCAVLWERGVLDALISGAGPRKFLENLMDFSGTYRITGPFSGMHTGGEAIDGYLATAMPFVAYAIIGTKTFQGRVMASALFALGSYTVAMTFTRATYGAFAVELAAMAVLGAFVARNEIKAFGSRVILLMVGALFLTGLLYGVRVWAGYQALFATVVLIWIAFFFPRRMRSLGSLASWIVLVLVVLGVGYEIFDDLKESRFRQWTTSAAVFFGVCGALAAGGCSYCLGRLSEGKLSTLNAVTGLMAASIVWFLVLPVLGGFTVATRFSATTSDMATRTDHWLNVLGLLKEDAVSIAIGNGVGTLPSEYHLQLTSDRLPQSFRFKSEAGVRYLQLDGGPLTIVQRVNMPVGANYEISALLRSRSERSGLSYSVCQRNILYFGGIGCRGGILKAVGEGGWTAVSGTGTVGAVGFGETFGWPVTLNLGAAGPSVEIQWVKLRDVRGSWLVNGDFSKRLDRWFVVSDYDHLPWHAKNNFLHVLVEQGVFGLLFFSAFLLGSAIVAIRRAAAGSVIHVILFGTLSGFFFVGLFGSPLDMPSVGFLFFLVTPLVFCSPMPAIAKPRELSGPAGAPLPTVSFVGGLESLARRYQEGTLSRSEFVAAKRQLLGLFLDDG